MLQYLGFGAIVNETEGRRAATQADLKTFNEPSDAQDDMEEKDRFLRQVSLLWHKGWWDGLVHCVSQGVVGWTSSFVTRWVVGWTSSFVKGVVGWTSSFVTRGVV